MYPVFQQPSVVIENNLHSTCVKMSLKLRLLRLFRNIYLDSIRIRTSCLLALALRVMNPNLGALYT